MDPPLFTPCHLNRDEEVPSPCEKKIVLAPEDEISLSSIFSALLRPIEPSETQFVHCNWDINPKDLLNEKQAIIFQEKLFISRLKNTNCKLNEDVKIFFERELEQIGKFCLNIEESFDGYVVYSNSKMRKGKSFVECGHQLKGKYDDKFMLICEKRTEFDRVDHARIEKTLEVRNSEDLHLIANRETKINEESQKLKAVVDIKDRDHVFVLDGGIMLLMRHLVINNFVGEFEYYTMSIFGRVLRCKLIVHKERKLVRIFYRTYKHTIRIVNQQCFNDELQDVSETYLTPAAHIVLHYWRDYTYLLHAACAEVKRVEQILPRLELMWRQDSILANKYKMDKQLNFNNTSKYLSAHPELADLLHDYVLNVLRYKPTNVLEFSMLFFKNLRKK